VAGVLPY